MTTMSSGRAKQRGERGSRTRSSGRSSATVARTTTTDAASHTPVPTTTNKRSVTGSQSRPNVSEQQQSAYLSASLVSSVPLEERGRRVYLVRTGEPCDRLFPMWRQESFKDGLYQILDLNQPIKVIMRRGGHSAFKNDGPLTQVGSLMSQLIGRGMAMRQLTVSRVFVSPSLRCVQTASNILSALRMSVKPNISIEPGLFEPLSWYWVDGLPKFIAPHDLVASGLPVDAAYKPVLAVNQLAERLYKEKTPQDAYRRVEEVTKELLQQAGRAGESVLIVTHGTTLDAVGRSLLSYADRPEKLEELHRVGLHYPYCSTLTFEMRIGNMWTLMPEALPPITYLAHSSAVDIPFLKRAIDTMI